MESGVTCTAMNRTASSLSCAECRGLLPRYTARELPLDLRSRVAAHLDGCDACYRQVQLERELSRELRQTLPAFGQLDHYGLQHMWSRVQHGLAQPRPTPSPREAARLGLCGVMVAAALLFTTLFTPDRLALALPLPPTPLAVQAAQTQTVVLTAFATPPAQATLPDGPMVPPTSSATEAPQLP